MENKEFVSVIEAARAYTQRGFFVLPIPPGNNHPVLDKWQNLRLTLDDLDSYFGDAESIGILLAPSGLADVDLNCAQAIGAADVLLPQTDLVHGHISSRRSHRYFRPTGISKANPSQTRVLRKTNPSEQSLWSCEQTGRP
jgi:hypothetical protein